jgi:hypothetical protein
MTFEERKAYWSERPRVDNAKLHAGSPMYYYCRLCGQQIVLPETHLQMAPWFCEDCCIEGRAKGPREAHPIRSRDPC